MEKKFNFVYITTNLINEKQYVGDHSCDILKNDNYLGSGICIIRAIKEYRKENFKREILEFFLTKQEAFNAQEKYIKLYQTHVDEGGYNISPTGGLGVKGNCSEELKQHFHEKYAGKTYEELYGIEKATLIKQKIHETLCKNEKIKKGTFKGKKHKSEFIEKMKKPKTIEHKQNISKALKGKKHTEEQNKRKSERMKGKKRSKETKQKISKSHNGLKSSEETKRKQRIKAKNRIKIMCIYCNKEFYPANFGRYHGKKCKQFNHQ